MRIELCDPFLAIWTTPEKLFQAALSKEGVILPDKSWNNDFSDKAPNFVLAQFSSFDFREVFFGDFGHFPGVSNEKLTDFSRSRIRPHGNTFNPGAFRWRLGRVD